MKKKEKKDDTKVKTFYKVKIYIMSLWLLFFLLFVLTFEWPFEGDCTFVGVSKMLKDNWLAMTSLIMCILGVVFSVGIKYEWKGVTNPPYKIKTVKNENYEYLTFLTTYIIPLICIDLEKIRYVIVLIVLLIIIGYIFIRMDLYYGNPTLALMGYRIYRVEIEDGESQEEKIIISKDKICKSDNISWIEMDNSVWVAKVVNNDGRRD